jgi:hypothetical protein
MVDLSRRVRYGLLESMEIPGKVAVFAKFSMDVKWSARARHIQLHADKLRLVDGKGSAHKAAGYTERGDIDFGGTFLSRSRPRNWQNAKPAFSELIFLVPEDAGKFKLTWLMRPIVNVLPK